jgi:hypothetical protein
MKLLTPELRASLPPLYAQEKAPDLDGGLHGSNLPERRSG